MVRAAARLHRHHAPWQCREEPQDLIPPSLLADDYGAARVCAVNLENRLGQINADCANLAHARLLQW
jgi:hypothetical protein